MDEIQHFDFSQLDYDVIGMIFERLISPEERHKYGQFYTRPEVVDLINSFCIREGTEKVLDPACGGGTFLVRAYARKRELALQVDHKQILSDLYGVDVSAFATHLTTINLATRDLVNENYPQVARSDFFDVLSSRPFLALPNHLPTGLTKSRDYTEISVPRLDAVIGNPPYVRQEEVPAKRKAAYSKLVSKEWPDIRLTSQSDLHIYFWPHAASFLKEDGHLCLLTSNQWLDAGYGFRLQKWILSHFVIEAILESVVEPWFVGARVNTIATILRRCEDRGARDRNRVRFVQLKVPLAELFHSDGTTAGQVTAADRLRNTLLSLDKSTVTAEYRVRVVEQRHLWDEGVEASLAVQDSAKATESLDGEPGQYYGGMWGKYLRAPDLWFQLQEQTQRRWKPLGALARVKRGLTSGADDYFYVKDVSDARLRECAGRSEFQAEYGAPRDAVEDGSLRIVLAKGQVHVLESKYLQPIVKSSKDIHGYAVLGADCTFRVLLASEKKSRLHGQHVLEYIKWGESLGVHKGPTCAARSSDSRAWYDLTGDDRGAVLWNKMRQYNNIAPLNKERLVTNCQLYEIVPHGSIDPEVWAGLLNSTPVLLSALQHGRPVGNEGNWEMMVVDTKMMLVPDLAQARPELLEELKNAFVKMKARTPLYFLSERTLAEYALRDEADSETLLASLPKSTEFDMPDRQALDDAVLKLLGVDSADARQELRQELYSVLSGYFETVREKEERSLDNKKHVTARASRRPAAIAAGIFQRITHEEPALLRTYEADFLDASQPLDVLDLPSTGRPVLENNLLDGFGVRFERKSPNGQQSFIQAEEYQVPLVYLLASTGHRGLVRVPHHKPACDRLLDAYSEFVEWRDSRLRQVVEETLADEDLRWRVLAALSLLVHNRTVRWTRQ